VVNLDVNLFDVNLVFLAAEAVQLISDDDLSSPFQNLEPKLWTEYDMIGTQPDTV
jgi:hypothetical protein